MNSKRDSFDVRIDDDLFEVIISYLPIEDKLRYESVSKRFQRFVFNKQHVLTISCEEKSFNNMKKHLVFNYKMIISYLKQLLRKFQFITTIEIDFFLLNNPKMIETIIENCHHLTSFSLSLNDVPLETLQAFCQKFGKQLKHISFEFYYSKFLKENLFHYSPNLLSVGSLNSEDLNIKSFPKKLIKFQDLMISVDTQNHSTFSANKLKNLKQLSFEIEVKATDMINNFIEELSKLKNLRILKIIVSEFRYESEIWSKIMECFAKNCLLLEYLYLSSDGSSYFISNVCFESISHFSGLKTLKFNAKCDQRIKDLTALQNCKNLLTLKLSVNGINDQILIGIHLIVPQLRKLEFNECHDIVVTEKGLESIAKLKHLTHLRFAVELTLTVKGLQKLMDSCERLKYVGIPLSHSPIYRKEEKKFQKLIEKYQNLRQIRDENQTKSLKWYSVFWNKIKRRTLKSETITRSHSIEIDLSKQSQ